MPYIGRGTSDDAIRSRFVYVASGSETSISGADANGAVLKFTDGAYVDVYLNGVLLKPTTDYNTNTANTIAGLAALSASDEVLIVVYDTFNIANTVDSFDGGTFQGKVTFENKIDMNGTELILDADADTSITSDTDDEIHIKIAGADDFKFKANTLEVQTGSNIDMNGTELILDADADSSITADTDDQIDIRIAGADDFQFTANTFTALSGSSIATNTISETTSASGVTVDGVLLKDGGIDINGNELILDADADTSITADTDDFIDFKVGGTDTVSIGGANSGMDVKSSLGLRVINGSETMWSVVPGNDGETTFLTNRTDGTSAHGTYNFNTRDGGNTLTRMHIAADGDIGIGTTAPDKPLHAKGGTSNGTMRAEHTSSGAYCDQLYDGIQTSGHGYWIVNGGNTFYLYTGSSSSIKFYVNENGACQHYHGHSSNMSMDIYNTNHSYNAEILRLRCNRGSTSSFWYQSGNSGFDGTPDRVYRINGDGTFYSDASSYNTGGGDYAEYFEWKDSNSSSEDRRACSVVLEDNKIRLATSDDNASKIIGIVSANPAVVGNNPDSWHGKYERDEYNSVVEEEFTTTEWTEPTVNERGVETTKDVIYATDQIPSDVKVPDDAVVKTKDDDGKTLMRNKYSSNYDTSKTWESREDRSEWDAIGLMGQLFLRKGQPTGDRWIKMRNVSDTMEEWLVR